MKTTIDAAGRVVIPKELRDAVGLVAGEVCVTRDGAAVRIEPLTTRGLVRRRGRLVIEADAALDDDAVRRLRLTDQRCARRDPRPTACWTPAPRWRSSSAGTRATPGPWLPSTAWCWVCRATRGSRPSP